MANRMLSVTTRRIGGHTRQRKFQAVVRDLVTDELLFQCSHRHHWEHKPPTNARNATSAYRCGYEVLQKIKSMSQGG